MMSRVRWVAKLAKPVRVCDNLGSIHSPFAIHNLLAAHHDQCHDGIADQVLTDEFSMFALFSMFWRLTTFRIGPADVPAASALLPTLVALFLVVNVGARVWLSSFDVAVALASSALILALWLVLVYVLVSFKNVRERFLQTSVALLGVDTVITLLNIIPGGLSLLVASDAPINDLLRIAVLVLFVWDMLAKGAIYREALNLGPMQGNLLAMCFAFGFTWIDISLFSPALNP